MFERTNKTDTEFIAAINPNYITVHPDESPQTPVSTETQSGSDDLFSLNAHTHIHTNYIHIYIYMRIRSHFRGNQELDDCIRLQRTKQLIPIDLFNVVLNMYANTVFIIFSVLLIGHSEISRIAWLYSH